MNFYIGDMSYQLLEEEEAYSLGDLQCEFVSIFIFIIMKDYNRILNFLQAWDLHMLLPTTDLESSFLYF